MKKIHIENEYEELFERLIKDENSIELLEDEDFCLWMVEEKGLRWGDIPKTLQNNKEWVSTAVFINPYLYEDIGVYQRDPNIIETVLDRDPYLISKVPQDLIDSDKIYSAIERDYNTYSVLPLRFREDENVLDYAFQCGMDSMEHIPHHLLSDIRIEELLYKDPSLLEFIPHRVLARQSVKEIVMNVYQETCNNYDWCIEHCVDNLEHPLHIVSTPIRHSEEFKRYVYDSNVKLYGMLESINKKDEALQFV